MRCTPATTIALAASAWRAVASLECENQVWAVINANRDNLAALQTITSPAWVSASEFRGTMSILQSCILTLVACIYTALHLNVPQKTDWKSVLLTKMTWISITLAAPEIVLYMAADQFIQAWKLRKRLRKLQTTSETVNKEFVFGMEYAFFIVMGGLRVPFSKLEGFISENDADLTRQASLKQAASNPEATLVLTASGVAQLATEDIWIYISRSNISDKSKSNLIQKALVLLQVSWTAMQCIARRIYGLPLTLLEIHTMVHVLCAVALYAFWFTKPLDIMEPEIRFGDSWLDSLAVLLQKSFYSSQTREMVKIPAEPSQLEGSESEPVYERVDGSHIIMPGQALASGLGRKSGSTWYDRYFTLSPAALERWHAVAARLPADEPGKYKCESVRRLLGMEIITTRRQLGVDIEAKNLTFAGETPHFELSDLSEFVIENFGLFFLAAIMPIAYGGIHLSAWNWEFPTEVEHLLWMISCIFIMAVVLALGLLAATIILIDFAWYLIAHELLKIPAWENLFNLEDHLDWVYRVIAVVVLVCYGCARVYIIIESFISLRSVPIGVYWTPSWIQMIPHI